MIGLIQEQFAAELGVISPTVNCWENGCATPSLVAMKMIEAKLDEIGLRGQDLWKKYCA